MSDTPTNAPPGWVLPVLLLLSLLCYAPALGNGFTYDDEVYVQVHGPDRAPLYLVQELRPLPEYFRHTMACQKLGGEFHEQGRGFRPLTVWSYALLHSLSRQADPQTPDGYRSTAFLQHLANLCLHSLAGLLVWLLLRRLRLGPWPSLVGAAVFLLQPMHSDPVISIVGRAELLAFVFGAGASLCYARGMRRLESAGLESAGLASAGLGTARLGPLLGGGLLLLAACLCKESAVAWLCFAPLYALVLRWRQEPQLGLGAALRQQGLMWLAPLLAGLGFALLYSQFLAGLSHDFDLLGRYEFNPLAGLPALERWPAALAIWGYGLSKLLFAPSLSVDYGLAVFQPDAAEPRLSWLAPGVLLAAAGILAALGLALRRARQQPLWLLAVAGTLGLSFVTSNIPVVIETIFGERLLFAASLGLSVAAAALAEAAPQAWRRALLCLLGLWLLWGAQWCLRRSFEWRSDETLVSADLPRQPRSLSLIRAKAGFASDPTETEALWQRALAIDPLYIWALNDLAVLRLQQRRIPEAERLLDRALASLAARSASRSTAGDRVHLNRGRLRLVQGRAEAAAREFAQALQINAHNIYARRHLCWLHQAAGRSTEVIALVTAGEKLQGRRPEFGLHRALCDARQGACQQAAPFLFDMLIKRGMGRNREARPGLELLRTCLQKLGNRPQELAAVEELLQRLGG